MTEPYGGARRLFLGLADDPMLSNYIEPQERIVACPNQDVVYGGSAIALDVSPAVIQVPDFGNRFWVYQIVDLRTDSFAELGAMFGTDYMTRTAVAKSNILVNKPSETTYFYQDLDASGGRLNGANRYTVTFTKDQGRFAAGARLLVTQGKVLRKREKGRATLNAPLFNRRRRPRSSS